MKRTSRNMKDLNMTTARRTGCQSKEKLTTTAAVAEKRRSTRRPGATQDWRWARSKMIRGRHQDDPARNRPRGTSTNESPHAGANNEKLSTRDISNELLQVGDEPHAGANNEKLSTRGTRYDKEPQGPHRVGLRGHPRRRPRRRRRRPRRR